MTTHGHPAPATTTDWDLDEVIVVESVRTAGGLMEQDTGTSPTVFLEITGHPNGANDEIVTRFLIPLDIVLRSMASLEHAGKTALLLAPTDRRSTGGADAYATPTMAAPATDMVEPEGN